MRVILEGCDGTGKTTLAKILAEKYGLDICHCTQHDAADYDFYRQTLRKENVVWDRHTLGELIYPHVFDRPQHIGTEDVRLILHYAKEENVKVFVLTADQKLIRKRLLDRGNEDERIMDYMAYIDNSFCYYAREFGVPIIDTTRMTLNEIFNLVEDRQIV